MPTYDIVCEGPGPHNPTDGVLGSSSIEGVSGMRCSAAACVPAPSPQQVAANAQDASVANLLAGAAALLVRLQALQDDITTIGATYTTARGTYQTALTALPASPTVAQLSTFLKNAQATYLLADNTALIAVGTKTSQTITELENVVEGLGNFIARASGSTVVLDAG